MANIAKKPKSNGSATATQDAVTLTPPAAPIGAIPPKSKLATALAAAPTPTIGSAPKAKPVQALSPKQNQVSLEIVQPGAKTVCVAGSFNEWKPERTPLVQKGNGRWVGDLAIKPGRHEYLFVVDGQWLPDPNAKEFVLNPFGGKNSVLIVSE